MDKNLQYIIDKYTELKSELIPTSYLTKDGDNLVFFQEQKLEKLEDNQSVSYKNVGEGVEKLIKGVNDYVDEIKNLSVAEIGSQSDWKHFVIANSKESFSISLTEVSNDLYYAYNVWSYLGIAVFKSLIDQIKVTTNFSIHNNTDDIDVDIEPVIYWLDAETRDVKQYSNKLPFLPDTIFGNLFLGVKIKEDIKADTELELDLGYDVEIRYNSLNTESTSSNVTSFKKITLDFDVNKGEVLFYSIVDLFGNIVKVKTNKDKTYEFNPDPASTLKTAGEKHVRATMNVLTIDKTNIPISNWEKIIVTKDYNLYDKVVDIKFKIYDSPLQSEYVYFPAGNDLVQKLKGIIDGF